MAAKFALTKEQRETVERPGAVAVTAGAGTGKTRAMIDRITRLLTGVERIEQALVLAFNEEAASEIRGRIYRAIMSEMEMAEGARLDRLTSLKENYSDNFVSTMHSFFAKTLRRFPYLVPGAGNDPGVDREYRVIEGFEADTLLLRSVDRILDETAFDPTASLREDLRRWLMHRRRRTLVGSAAKALIARRYDLQPWMNRFLTTDTDALLDAYRADAEQYIANLKEEFFNSAQVLDLTRAVENCPPPKDGEDKMAELRENMLEAAEERDSVRIRELFTTSAGKARRFTRVGRSVFWGGETLETLRALMNEYAELVEAEPSLDLAWNDDLEREALETLKSLAKLAEAGGELYSRRKRIQNALDFNDLEGLAHGVIHHPEGLRTFREQFRAVFIDEFQDTNRRQWDIFKHLGTDADGSVADAGKLFIVGDEKQAIYSFRGGEVDLFSQARAEFDPDAELYLTANFRSLPNLILFFNRFFESLLTGGASYEAEAQSLRAGDAPTPPQKGAPLQEGGCVYRFIVPDEKEKTREREANAVADLIQEISEGRQEAKFPGIADRIAASEPAVAVLFRRSTHQRLYEDALRRRGVPYVASRGRGFFQRQEICDLRNALRVINDPADEIAFAGFLRSPLIGCSDEGLLLLSAAGESSRGRLRNRLERLPDLAELNELSEEDAAALRKAKALLSRWVETSRASGVADTLTAVIEESGMYAPLAMGVMGQQRVLNVEKFIDFARDWESVGSGALVDFMRYLDALDAGFSDAGDADLPDGGSIQLLTVHRAKGLEWPVVILPDMDAGFQYRIDATSNWAGVAVGRLAGFGGRDEFEAAVKITLDPEEKNAPQPFMWEALNIENRKRTRAEEKRLLYVALTRAKERLVLFTREKENPPQSVKAGNCWTDWIETILSEWDEEEYVGVYDLPKGDAGVPLQPIQVGAPVDFDADAVWERYAPPDDSPTDSRSTDLGRFLLPLALDGMDEESLTERAEAHLRAGSVDSTQKEAAQAARCAVLTKKLLQETYPGAEILTNLAFPNADPFDGSIDQIDALMMGEEGPLAAAVVFYGGSADIHEAARSAAEAALRLLECPQLTGVAVAFVNGEPTSAFHTAHRQIEEE